ncbi:putative RND superfamily drug exporter [Mycolicibacterium chubuense NBB4]|uniref:Putative RND superfamily drug exporter n=1 Tax=Mycolicibacterium chubuense (strain NBB4) TaxID=710421 RepID=I4BQP0_MYCCN|nr:MMPL family transporter [Mycolicibacterium chubuense]AFM19597.1 putative RND superfamily drug exporter [Mycolicibacterium chubuense NBB4]
MLDLISRLAIVAPKRVIAVAIALMALAGVLAAPVGSMLSAGGFTDPDAQSNQANRVLTEEFHRGFVNLNLLVTASEPVSSPSVRSALDRLVAELRSSEHVARVLSPTETADPVGAGLVSKDGKSALVIAYLDGDESTGIADSTALVERFVGQREPGLTIAAGGPGAVYGQVNEQARKDLTLSEAIVLPLTFLVLIWVFGGLFAAMVPLAVGAFAISGSVAILRVVAEFAEVSVFALNLAVAMGLALAVDYSLLLVSRYREEIGDGSDPDEALRRTMRTAGRTVVFSAVTVALCLATMAVFPMYFLRSFAYAAVSVVMLAALAALVITPAAIRVTGDRIGKPGKHKPLTESRWYRWAQTVMRRPWLAVAFTVVPLIVVGLPFLDVEFGFPDDRILPTSSPARQVGDQTREDFTQDAGLPVHIVLSHGDGFGGAGDVDAYAAELSKVPSVVVAVGPDATYAAGRAVGPAAGESATAADHSFLTVTSTTEPFSAESDRLLDRLHAIPPPEGTTALFTGAAQSNRDGVESISSRLPALLGLIAVVMYVLLFLLTGSLVIPLKALILNALSLTATFGALVWIFQEGHLGGLGTTVVGTLVSTIPVLMFCVAFGLSMDYEVFIIARTREFWLASDRSDGANRRAVALGLAGTGRIVTAAALVMAITFAGLTASQVSMLRIFGFGLAVAILVDAVIIRSVLLPAVMVLLGRWNWWAPRVLGRMHDRVSVNEGSAHRDPVVSGERT